MIFHTFGNKENKAIVLIHGMLTPWQIWNTAIERFSNNYYVVVPELDGHTEQEPSVFTSVKDESDKIIEYIRDELGGKVHVLAGLSMGGRIAATLAQSSDITIDILVLDGAPLTKINVFLKFIFKKNYKLIVKKSKARDAKTLESAKKDFLPEERIEDYLKVADNMTPESINAVIDTVFTDFEYKTYSNIKKILFMHGTEGSESEAHKCAVKLKEANPQTEIRSFDGLAHAELACFKPEQWVREVEGFIS